MSFGKLAQQIVDSLLDEGTPPPPIPAWTIANNRSQEKFGKKLSACTSNEMNKIVDLGSLDRLSIKIGEHGFSTMKEEDMELLLNSNPGHLRVNESHLERSRSLSQSLRSRRR